MFNVFVVVVVFVAAVAILSAFRSLSLALSFPILFCLSISTLLSLSLSLSLDPFNLFSAALFKSYSEYRAPAAILVTLKMHPSSHVNAPIRRRVVDLSHSRRLTFPRRSPISPKSREAHK